MTKPFANLDDDPRTTAQQELAELTDWQRRLAVADFEFSPDQRAVIEKLFSPKDRTELEKVYHEAWYSAARNGIAAAIEQRKELLGISPPENLPNGTNDPE